MDEVLKQVHGKEISYNNLLDIDAALNLMEEFKDSAPTFAILKHNNACGLATRSSLPLAYKDALAADPVSAFGGILIANRDIDPGTATAINELFCEVVISPGFHPDALSILSSKKNRILMVRKETPLPQKVFRSALNGVLVQDRDSSCETKDQLKLVTTKSCNESEMMDLVFALKLAKHTKSNTIVLAKNQQLCASGTGQTSRVDALRQAIDKAKAFGFDLNGAVMASDAFFPFPDCVEIAHQAGIRAVVQPGGSLKDQESIDFCNAHEMSMYLSGVRHFRH
jgi:phosphoribosylaminoimidazolecarboxamide formyltransferase/IMP cyclohydrolase